MIYRTTRIFLLFVFVVLILIPCSIVFLGTFKTDVKILSDPLALPDSWSLENFVRLFESDRILTPTRNSLIVSCFSVGLTLLLASMASFAIARSITVSGKVLFLLFSIGLAIPGQVNVIPIYLMFVKLNLTNSLFGLVLVNIALTLPISIFILTSFIKDLPSEMFEAASIDGAKSFRTFWSIALPLSRPAIGATAIFLFVITWNDLLYPLMLIGENSKKTLPLMMLDFKGEFTTEYSMIYTSIVIASLPMILMYVIFQRSFISGLTQGAVKG